MVGTPQLPLKYRRKGDLDYRVCSPDLDMAYHFPTPSFYSRVGSDDSMPRSPVFYSSSSSIAPSSPMRSLHTPEPPSSPLAEVHVASSPKSFWEVAFNYGPEFPYKSRSTTKSSSPDSVFGGRGQLFSRRRSSNASVPTLVSDVDPSEYSEDIDPFNVEDDSIEDFDSIEKVNAVKRKEKDPARGIGIPHVRRDDKSNGFAEGGMWSGEIDVASVLLDLSRQARIAPVEPKTMDAAIKPIDRLLSCRPTTEETTSSILPSSISTALLHTEERSNVASQALAQTPCTLQVDEPAPSSYLDECDPVSYPASPELIVGPLNFVNDISHSRPLEAKDSPQRGEPIRLPSVVPCAEIDSEKSTDGLDTVDIGTTMLSVKPRGVAVTSAGSLHISEAKSTRAVINEDLPSEVDSVVASIFFNTLTPLSSPTIDPTDDNGAISDYIGYLSNLSSPATNTLDLAVPYETSELHSVPSNRQDFAEEKENIDIAPSRTPPIPGPSKSRSTSTDQCKILVNITSDPPLRKSKLKQSLCEVEVDTNAMERKRKRSRQPSMDEKRYSSPALSVTESITSRPRKKKGRKMALDTSQHMLGNESTKKTDSLLPCASRVSALSSSVPTDRDTALNNSADDANAKAEMHGCLIQAMALSRTSSMPASSLLREVLRENPHLGDRRSKEDWLDMVEDVLTNNDVFGRVDREGLDADDKPLEAQWFYIPENDPDQDRATLLREMMPKKRKETKKHKQYFYKPLGKITRWDGEDDA